MDYDPKILYLCDFDLTRNSGKDRATRQKLAALRECVSFLKVISNGFGKRYRIAAVFLLDLKACYSLINYKPDLFISRGYSGLLSIFLSKILRITTVREVHASAIEELNLLPYKGFKLKVIESMTKLSHYLDCLSDIRIFNNPDLLEYYRKSGLATDKDFYVYNGFDPNSRSALSKSEARKKFELGESEKLIVFIGSASKWHGVDYLVELQKEFNNYGDDIKIIFGGGDVSEFDPCSVCLNISPLEDENCSDLIRAADFCALPVKSNRVSPGSPLKLYDYIANDRHVFAQRDTNGYSDEVERLSVGYQVDFTNPSETRLTIISAFKAHAHKSFNDVKATWSDRMREWLRGMSNAHR